MRRASVCLIAVFLASCSSASAPGAGEVVDQIDAAQRAQLQSELRNLVVAEEVYFAENESYSTDLTVIGYTPPEDVTVSVVSADATGFCAEASHADAPEAKMRVMSGNTQVEDGACPTS